MASRAQMCTKKVSFRSRGKAEAVAKQFGQRVYECPVCFCWHCTNKENWRDEFVDEEQVRKQLADLERRLRTEYNEILRKKNSLITELQRKIKTLRRGRDEEDSEQDQYEYSDHNGK